MRLSACPPCSSSPPPPSSPLPAPSAVSRMAAVGGISSFLGTPRKDSPLGTFTPDAFHAFPSPEPALLDGLGYHCIAHCGVYGESYQPCLPMLLVALGGDSKAGLPPTLLASLPEVKTDIYVVMHTDPPPMPCQKFICDNYDEGECGGGSASRFSAWCSPSFELTPSFHIPTTVFVFLLTLQ